MIWILLFLIILYILYAYFKSKERNKLKESLSDQEFRKSYIQNSIEEVFQHYLKTDLEELSNFKKKLREAQESNNESVIDDVKFQVQLFSDEITALKQIKKDLQNKNDPIWHHNDFSEEGLVDLKEKISDDFSQSARHALPKIGSR